MIYWFKLRIYIEKLAAVRVFDQNYVDHKFKPSQKPKSKKMQNKDGQQYGLNVWSTYPLEIAERSVCGKKMQFMIYIILAKKGGCRS